MHGSFLLAMAAMGAVSAVIAAALASQPAASQPAEITATGALPEGDNGLARKHPGEEKIAKDSAVIFADDFESYAKPAELEKRWDAVYQKKLVTLDSEKE